MAWFKFGKNDDRVSTQAPAESVEAMRQKAKFRLIGSVVLVLAGVVGFPILFDSQPRPVPVDIPIDIPDKAKVKPLPLPAGGAPTQPAPAAKVDDKSSLSDKEEVVSPAKTPTPAAAAKPSAGAVAAGAAAAGAAGVAGAIASSGDDAARKAADKAKADKAAADKAAAADRASVDKAAADKQAADKAKKLAADKAALEASRAKALLEGKPGETKPAPVAATAPPAATGERFIVQFGAFTDVEKSREVRQRVEKAGLKTYSQIAKTQEGDLIRVRVGPFTSKDEADKAAAKIKALGLPASILTL